MASKEALASLGLDWAGSHEPADYTCAEQFAYERIESLIALVEDLLPYARMGLTYEGDPRWWPVVEDDHPHSGNWVHLNEDGIFDGGRVPLSDQDATIINAIREAVREDWHPTED